MESTISVTTTTLALFNVSKALNRHFSKTSPSLFLHSRLLSRRFNYIPCNSGIHRPFCFGSTSCSSLRTLCAVLLPLHPRLQCVSSSSASFASGGGNGGFGESSGGGGDGGSEGGDPKSNLVAGAAEEISVFSPDVIILDVGGMTCGGCAASVKRILENQPQVSSATVNLATETAIIWPVSEAKVAPDWQKQLGESLAKHLTTCGFTSNLRGIGASEEDMSS